MRTMNKTTTKKQFTEAWQYHQNTISGILQSCTFKNVFKLERMHGRNEHACGSYILILALKQSHCGKFF